MSSTGVNSGAAAILVCSVEGEWKQKTRNIPRLFLNFVESSESDAHCSCSDLRHSLLRSLIDRPGHALSWFCRGSAEYCAFLVDFRGRCLSSYAHHHLRPPHTRLSRAQPDTRRFKTLNAGRAGQSGGWGGPHRYAMCVERDHESFHPPPSHMLFPYIVHRTHNRTRSRRLESWQQTSPFPSSPR